ncbi:BMC domain protein [Acididesulfobacillus acetoxydans]|uniref:BMC domain protein n=1 Tax=Acididesulfobacillus acetoxydans TaxID=1561005 RepID=A0A8S0W348_9FIRM|nr:BMC domain-containing protein [Acididesulfobacillus acetoxydans]CAA7601298.1 BMC domain protein [Acididesulfobacillus acetoxydans]CEJ08792.1 Microcompartment protein, bacteria [Acididesulfobacillus acetoxydans]
MACLGAERQAEMALGIIEVQGLVAALAAADAAAKAADVTLLGYEPTKGGGLVTLKLTGEVAAALAAVSAATEAASALSLVYASRVIAKPAADFGN